MSESREHMLNKIKQALSIKVSVPFSTVPYNPPHFMPSKEELEVEFAENFSGLLGKFSYCVNSEELVLQLHSLIEKRSWSRIYCRDEALKSFLEKNGCNIYYSDDLNNCDVAITDCEFLIARTGSMLLSSGQQSGRTVSVYAPIHICIAKTSQLVYDIDDALQQMKLRYGNNLPSLMSFATGPSRTADIEKTLVVGVHGPKEVFCFLIDE